MIKGGGSGLGLAGDALVGLDTGGDDKVGVGETDDSESASAHLARSGHVSARTCGRWRPGGFPAAGAGVCEGFAKGAGTDGGPEDPTDDVVGRGLTEGRAAGRARGLDGGGINMELVGTAAPMTLPMPASLA